MTPRASAKVWPKNGTPNEPGAVGILRSPQRMRPLRASLQRKVQRFGQKATRAAHASAPQGDVGGGQQQQGVRRQLRARFRGDHRATALPKRRRPSRDCVTRVVRSTGGPGQHPSERRASKWPPSYTASVRGTARTQGNVRLCPNACAFATCPRARQRGGAPRRFRSTCCTRC